MNFGQYKFYDRTAEELIKKVLQADWALQLVAFEKKISKNGNLQTVCRLYAIDDNQNLMPLTSAFASSCGLRVGKRGLMTVTGSPQYASKWVADRLYIIGNLGYTPNVRFVEV